MRPLNTTRRRFILQRLIFYFLSGVAEALLFLSGGRVRGILLLLCLSGEWKKDFQDPTRSDFFLINRERRFSDEGSSNGATVLLATPASRGLIGPVHFAFVAPFFSGGRVDWILHKSSKRVSLWFSNRFVNNCRLDIVRRVDFLAPRVYLNILSVLDLSLSLSLSLLFVLKIRFIARLFLPVSL